LTRVVSESTARLGDLERSERFEVANESRRRLRDALSLVDPAVAGVLLIMPWVGSFILTASVQGTDWRWGTFAWVVLAMYGVVALAVWAGNRLTDRGGGAGVALSVGPEGVLLNDSRAGTELFSFERLTSVRTRGRVVDIRVRRHGLMSFPLQSSEDATRFVKLLEGFRATEDKGATAREVAKRGGDSHLAAVDQLTAAASGQASYRRERLTVDDLADLVASAETRPRFRIAAAAALRRIDKERADRTAELVGQRTVNEPLRIALDDAMNDLVDEERIREADRWHDPEGPAA
jgi:hypothetical protein